MRVLILSDLHANLPATEAVLDHAARGGWGRALVLGDLVGYGADPRPVIDIVRNLHDATVIRGNHDKVAAGIDDPADFNAIARQAAEWTAVQLDSERRDYLKALPQGPLAIDGLPLDVAICHGAPFDEDYYLFDAHDAAAAFAATTAALLFFGHTHLQMAFRQMGLHQAVAAIDDEDLDVATGRLLVNPGSVGQPRDGDARAAYAVLDTTASRVTMYRVDYDIAEAQRRILDAALHPHLAQRLSVGR
jgi:predicted phosphodiesterase